PQGNDLDKPLGREMRHRPHGAPCGVGCTIWNHRSGRDARPPAPETPPVMSTMNAASSSTVPLNAAHSSRSCSISDGQNSVRGVFVPCAVVWLNGPAPTWTVAPVPASFHRRIARRRIAFTAPTSSGRPTNSGSFRQGAASAASASASSIISWALASSIFANGVRSFGIRNATPATPYLSLVVRLAPRLALRGRLRGLPLGAEATDHHLIGGDSHPRHLVGRRSHQPAGATS